jgi:hypothetical protein
MTADSWLNVIDPLQKLGAIVHLGEPEFQSLNLAR